MTEHDKMILNPEATVERTSADEMALMIEGLYNGIVAGLKKLKNDLCTELKYSAAQVTASCEQSQRDARQLVAKNQATIQAISKELKYGYQQDEMLHDDLVRRLDDVLSKIDTVEGKIAAVEGVEKLIPVVEEMSADLTAKIEAIPVTDADEIVEKVKAILPTYESVDYSRVTEIVNSAVINSENAIIEQTQEIVDKASVAVAEQTQRVLDAVSAIVIPEGVDYARIVEEVSERVVELLAEREAATAVVETV